MKSKEEIEQLAEKEYWNSNTESRSFIKGYTQCQEDMADEIKEVYAHLYACMPSINSLNKQD